MLDPHLERSEHRGPAVTVAERASRAPGGDLPGTFGDGDERACAVVDLLELEGRGGRTVGDGGLAAPADDDPVRRGRLEDLDRERTGKVGEVPGDLGSRFETTLGSPRW